EHDLHLRLEHRLRERLEQDLLSLHVGEPGAPDRVVAFGADLPGDGSALKSGIGEELGNRVFRHVVLFGLEQGYIVIGSAANYHGFDAVSPTPRSATLNTTGT